MSTCPWSKAREYHNSCLPGAPDRWGGLVLVGNDSMRACTYRPDASRMVVFSLSTGSCLQRALASLPGRHFTEIALGPDGLPYAAYGASRPITAYDVTTGEPVDVVCPGCLPPGAPADLAFVPPMAGGTCVIPVIRSSC